MRCERHNRLKALVISTNNRKSPRSNSFVNILAMLSSSASSWSVVFLAVLYHFTCSFTELGFWNTAPDECNMFHIVVFFLSELSPLSRSFFLYERFKNILPTPHSWFCGLHNAFQFYILFLVNISWVYS